MNYPQKRLYRGITDAVVDTVALALRLQHASIPQHLELLANDGLLRAFYCRNNLGHPLRCRFRAKEVEDA